MCIRDRQAVERCRRTGDLEGVIVGTFRARAAQRTQFRHFTDETVQRYVHDLGKHRHKHTLSDRLLVSTRKLSSIEDRSHTDRITTLSQPLALDFAAPAGLTPRRAIAQLMT